MRRLAGFYAFAALVVALPFVFPDNYFVTVVGVTVGINAILAVSLNLFMGYAGQISLGHAAFFGIGAYASAILTTRYGIDPWIAMAAGLVASGLIALLLARPILRLHGHYLAMATLGFGIIVNIVMKEAEDYTGGPDGMTGIPPLPLLGHQIDTDIEWYALVAAVLLFTIWVSLNIFHSRAGRALRAVHGSEVAARTLGVDTAAAKTQVFVLAALLASLAGSLFAHQQGFVSPDSFGFFFSIELVTMVVLGGLGATFGAVFGAVVLSYLPEVLVVLEDYEVLVFGAVLMLIMIFLPQGLFVTATRALQGRLLRRRRRGTAAPAEA